MKLRGSNVDAGIMLERWMHETPGLEEVGGITHYIPIGPWDTCECSFVVPDASSPLPPPAGKLITDHGKNGNFFLAGSTPEQRHTKQVIGTLFRQDVKVKKEIFLKKKPLRFLSWFCSDGFRFILFFPVVIGILKVVEDDVPIGWLSS